MLAYLEDFGRMLFLAAAIILAAVIGLGVAMLTGLMAAIARVRRAR